MAQQRCVLFGDEQYARSGVNDYFISAHEVVDGLKYIWILPLS
ncbi:hypothetical protein FHW36_107368 [Chitinophaga polysaccharea]|uniref:Uncharacterized protein n=1 Tax=Chitinophaga polysaccharea TaxID=1293035 RepID=A0A561PH39_9BACT|nr:hypothetical protein FHW36_107368 [Chitinophaga polysaccharea]